jgi:hypothetical protein
VFGVLVALALATAAGACGGDDGGGADAREVVKQTFEGGKRVDSGKLDLSMTAKLTGTGLAATQLQEPIVIKMTGPFQSRGEDALPAMDLVLSVSGSGQDFSAGAISTGDKGYVTFQGKPYRVPDSVFGRFKRGFEEQQRKDNQSSQTIDLSALGVNPDAWLENPKDEGEEEVGGTTTTHVSSDVDLDALLKDFDNLLKRADRLGLSQQQLQQVPRGLDSRTRKQIRDSVKRAKVDIWTGKEDKTLRRLELDLSFELPPALQEQAQGVKGGDVKLELEVADVNEPQEIKPPANPRPWSELQRLLPQGGAFGGSSGGTGGSSGGSAPGGTGPGTGGSSSKRAQDYLKCVQKAERPEDVDRCGAILGR